MKSTMTQLQQTTSQSWSPASASGLRQVSDKVLVEGLSRIKSMTVVDFGIGMEQGSGDSGIAILCLNDSPFMNLS